MRVKLHIKKFKYMYSIGTLLCLGLFFYVCSIHIDEVGSQEFHPRVVQERPRVTRVPRILHILWCGNKTFDFRHYLSVLSSIRFSRPESIRFYNDVPPRVDRHSYHTWFNEWKNSTRELRIEEVKGDICENEVKKIKFIRKLLLLDGGLYVGRNTIFTKDLDLDVEYSDHLVSSYEGYLMTVVGAESVRPPSARDYIHCIGDDQYRLISEYAKDPGYLCAYKQLHPKNLLSELKEDRYIKLARKLFYGNDGELPKGITKTSYNLVVVEVVGGLGIMKAEPSPSEIVPNIAHQLWISSSPMDFLFYLSSLSLLNVVKVDRLYIYGERTPGGKYWRQLEKNSKVSFIPIPRPDTVYNQRTGDPRLASDIFRSKVMSKYGGIYSDVDVIWTRRPPAILWHYEAVASLDWAHSYPPYPDYMNLGASMACYPSFNKNGFWKYYTDSLRDLRDRTFGYNGLLQPYKIYERHPQSILVDDHLQVMCFKAKCYPRWGQNFKDISWSKDTSAFHWTWPTPLEFTDLKSLLNSEGQWAEIGQFVVQQSNITILN